MAEVGASSENTQSVRTRHFIPEKRLSEVLGDLFACQMATGTIAKTTKTFDTDLEPVINYTINIKGKICTSQTSG
jgi:hypothetical protein